MSNLQLRVSGLGSFAAEFKGFENLGLSALRALIFQQRITSS